MAAPYVATGGKPTFNEFMTPIGLIVHLYHDKPQLKTKDQYGRIPDLDENGMQKAEYKVTLAWSKSRLPELQEPLINLAHQTKLEAWPESGVPGAFFALEPFFRDGDNPAHNTKGREYLRGRYYLNFKQPAKFVIDPQTKRLIGYDGGPGLLGPYGPEDKILPMDIYPGCTGRVSGIMFGTEYAGRNFISVRLNNIQLYETPDTNKELTRIGGGARPTAESQFGAIKTGPRPINPQQQPFGSLLGTGAAPPQNFGTDQFGYPVPGAGGRTVL